MHLECKKFINLGPKAMSYITSPAIWPHKTQEECQNKDFLENFNFTLAVSF